MFKLIVLFFCCFNFYCLKIAAQTDAFAGTWQMEYTPAKNLPPVKFQLNIAPSQRNILYPAHLKIECDNFTGEYELLLVKKNSRELGISKNKYARLEQPFTLHNWLLLLSGTFDLSKNSRSIQILERYLSKKSIGFAKPW